MPTTKEIHQELVRNLKQWQKVENASITQTAKVLAETENPLIRFVMEIIQRDSNFHHRIQQLMIDSLEKEPIQLQVEELERIWGTIERHIEIEKRTIAFGEAVHTLLGKSSTDATLQYMLSYLLKDEQKHEKLLSDLALIKQGMYP